MSNYFLHYGQFYRKIFFILSSTLAVIIYFFRTDFQGGSAKNLYHSVHSQILSLADDFSIYPAHDYKGETKSSVDEEKRLNPRLTKTESDFIDLMNNLNLSYPKMIDVALPWNLNCGAEPIQK